MAALHLTFLFALAACVLWLGYLGYVTREGE